MNGRNREKEIKRQILIKRAEPANRARRYNGTRLCVTELKSNLIEIKILNKYDNGDLVLLPRIPIMPTNLPFEFKWLQFPIRLAFAMSINKAQGQTLNTVGLNLQESCFLMIYMLVV